MKKILSVVLIFATSVQPVFSLQVDPFTKEDQKASFAQEKQTVLSSLPVEPMQVEESAFDQIMTAVGDLSAASAVVYSVAKEEVLSFLTRSIQNTPSLRSFVYWGGTLIQRLPPGLLVSTAKVAIPALAILGVIASTYETYQGWDSTKTIFSNITSGLGVALSRIWEPLKPFAGYTAAIALQSFLVYTSTGFFMSFYKTLFSLNVSLFSAIAVDSPWRLLMYPLTLAEMSMVSPFAYGAYVAFPESLQLQKNLFKATAQFDILALQEIFSQRIPAYLGHITSTAFHVFRDRLQWIKDLFFGGKSADM